VRARPAHRKVEAAALAGVPLLLASALASCGRDAHIRDDMDGGSIGTVQPRPTPEGGVPAVDAGLESEEFGACGDRPAQACGGANDFACGFRFWVNLHAGDCQRLTDCSTNGWLSVRMGESGCVTEIGMTDPNPEFVACLVDRIGSVRCECPSATEEFFLGETNRGCFSDAGPKG
jgi:hypothetical protein